MGKVEEMRFRAFKKLFQHSFRTHIPCSWHRCLKLIFTVSAYSFSDFGRKSKVGYFPVDKMVSSLIFMISNRFSNQKV